MTSPVEEWVWVPKEPTGEMCCAIFDPDARGTAPACDLVKDAANETVARLWSAMISAAPAHPSTDEARERLDKLVDELLGNRFCMSTWSEANMAQERAEFNQWVADLRAILGARP